MTTLGVLVWAFMCAAVMAAIMLFMLNVAITAANVASGRLF